MSNEDLSRPHNKGLQAALNLSCDDYFTASSPMIRTFLDNHYDNFYAYYFAGRTFDARQKLTQILKGKNLDNVELIKMALDNMSFLDRVYRVDQLSILENDIITISGRQRRGLVLTKLRVNEGDGDVNTRLEKLKELGATDKTFDRLEQMTNMDKEIWKYYSEQ